MLDRDDARRKSGSVGVPPPFYEMRIVGEDGRDLPVREVGEIVGRGPSGAFAVAGIATLIVVAIYFAFYFFIYLPRGAVQ